MIIIQTQDGGTVGEGLSKILARIVKKLEQDSGHISTDVMTKSVKNWVQNRYPNSKHWSPSKVKKGNSIGVVGQTNIDIPGASRAYADITIRPTRARALTIPIHQRAYGKKVDDFNGLFKPKGKNILAVNEGGQLVAMFALAQSAFQRRDPYLLPTDEHLASGIFRAIKPIL